MNAPRYRKIPACGALRRPQRRDSVIAKRRTRPARRKPLLYVIKHIITYRREGRGGQRRYRGASAGRSRPSTLPFLPILPLGSSTRANTPLHPHWSMSRSCTAATSWVPAATTCATAPAPRLRPSSFGADSEGHGQLQNRPSDRSSRIADSTLSNRQNMRFTSLLAPIGILYRSARANTPLHPH